MNEKRVGIANASKEERLRMQLYVETQHDGGNPSQLLELLAEATEGGIWERLTNGDGKPLTFLEFIERPYPDGIGLSRDDLKTIIRLKHQYERREKHDNEIAERMEAMRRRVIDLLHPIAATEDEVKELRAEGGKEGGRGRKKPSLYYNEGLELGTSKGYALRRLKRDRPDLAQKVIMGDISANAAAIKAGFRTKTISIPIDPERAARSIKRHFDEEQLEELIDLLTGS